MIRLEELRFNAGLSINQLAAETGVAHMTVRRIENGATARPHPENVKALADFFGLSALEVLAEVPPAEPAAAEVSS